MQYRHLDVPRKVTDKLLASGGVKESPSALAMHDVLFLLVVGVVDLD